jgi:hypothetical protein
MNATMALSARRRLFSDANQIMPAVTARVMVLPAVPA